jgi:hypothetical protein
MPAKHLERLVASARGVEAAPTMDCRQGRHSRLPSAPLTLTSALTGVALLLSASSASAAEDDAMMILKRMSDYVSAQKAISLSYDSDIEVVTSEIQKIQYTSSGRVLLSRPDKLRATRVGGYADVEFVFDGKTASVLGKNMNAFVQMDAPGSVEQIIDRLRNKYSVSLPGADLLLSNSFEALSPDVVQAAHVGEGVVDGIECEHLAFRNDETDWQIWIQSGETPIPRKYVITSKTEAAAPQYTLVIRDWKTDAQPGADAFAFKAPEGAKKLDPAALAALDEVPPGLPKGEKK